MEQSTIMKRLGAFKSVTNFTSSNGNDVPNQFEIRFEKGTVFQSYTSIIAVTTNSGNIFLGGDWDYSTTTGRYRNQFLGESKKETEQKIKLGTYKMLK